VVACYCACNVGDICCVEACGPAITSSCVSGAESLGQCAIDNCASACTGITLSGTCSLDAGPTDAGVGQDSAPGTDAGGGDATTSDGGSLSDGGDAGEGNMGTDSGSDAGTDSGADAGCTAVAATPVPLSAGSSACAVNDGGAVKCWGPFLGPLAVGGPDSGPVSGDAGAPNATATQVPDLTSGVTAVSVGPLTGAYACAVDAAGNVECWGANVSGVLGSSSPANGSATPVEIVGLPGGAVAVAAGNNFACAVTGCGDVECWGANGDGELGNSATGAGGPTPVQVTGITSGATEVAAGVNFACALVNGGVQCWGFGLAGQLGNGVVASSSFPVTVLDLAGAAPLTGATAVSVGNDVACAIVGGAAQCWGQNGGRLGNGDAGASVFAQPTPVQVVGLTSGVTAISVASGLACAVMAGNVYCWGISNSQGQLGNDNGPTNFLSPVEVVSIDNATAVSAASSYACALLATNQVWCWGTNANGLLGNDGVGASSPVPVQVVGFP
jgi:alpha-tubulin suppressor-like RCC1 family protein